MFTCQFEKKYMSYGIPCDNQLLFNTNYVLEYDSIHIFKINKIILCCKILVIKL